MTIRSARFALALCGAVLMSACVRMPSDGPVIDVRADATDVSTPGISFDPKPPQKGESATEIVLHFLEAMKATPIDASVARQFLSSDAKVRWTPERSIMTYGDVGSPTGELQVELLLMDLEEYDVRGAWAGSSVQERVRFGMTVESGEWRIESLPDALIVPETWFQDRYRRVSLHFFDPTAQILVPEPVFVPDGDQLASSMVSGLLSDPTDDPRVTRTYVPPGFESGIVPLTSDGIADVSLLGDPSEVDDAARELILAQLVWTLRQEDRIQAVRLAIGEDEQGRLAEAPEFKLFGGDGFDPNAFDPTGAQASGDLFGLVDGRVVRGSITSLAATSGPLGTKRFGITSIGVNLAGDQVAAISGDGGAVLVAPVDGEGGVKEVASGARNFLPPAWDFADRIWLTDRARGGAVISFVTADQPPRAIAVPGVTGRDVRHVLVSRDGSRLVAVIRTRQGDRVVTSRILHNGEGGVLRATRAVALDFLPDTDPPVIRDIGWRSSTSVSLVTDLTEDRSQVETISVDGSPGALAFEGSTQLAGRTRELVSSPVELAEVYALARDAVSDLSAPERPLSPPPEGISSLTYVG